MKKITSLKLQMKMCLLFFFQARARAAVGLFLTFAVAYNIPRFFELTWEPVSYENVTLDFDADLRFGENIARYAPTPMRMNYHYIRLKVFKNTYIGFYSLYCILIFERRDTDFSNVIWLYFSIYVTWMYLVFMYIVPFSCLAIFNLLIFLAIRRASLQRALLTSQEKKDHNLASMFLVVVMVFFICNSLSLIVNILEV